MKDFKLIGKYKSIHQFMVPLYEGDSNNIDDEETANAVDNIFAHFIHTQKQHCESESPHAEEGEHGFSHIGTIEDSNKCAAFTAALQDHAFFHATTSSKQSPRFGTSFDGVMLDTGAVHGSSAEKLQY